jgi:hypothetical protein
VLGKTMINAALCGAMRRFFNAAKRTGFFLSHLL